MSNQSTNRRTRIPLTLQAVFLASNKGQEVNKPPPNRNANRVFFRNWFFQRQAGSNETVKASVTSNKDKKVVGLPPPAVIAIERTAADESVRDSVESPQDYLDHLLQSRGYSTHRFQTLETAYYNKPTPLQKASYDVYLLRLARQGDVETFREVFACGLSPNPCNMYGESLLHTICRQSKHAFFKVLCEAGCSLQVSDDYGRTPLHDACWSPRPCFQMIKEIILADRHLFYMADCRGTLPLSYVRRDLWDDWKAFLHSNKDVFWPCRSSRSLARLPLLVTEPKNSQPLPDPKDALSVELASMLASGKMTAKEVMMLKYDDDDSTTDDCSESFDDDSESDEDEDEDEVEGSDDEGEDDEDEYEQ
jgi:ankyrin repeat protein